MGVLVYTSRDRDQAITAISSLKEGGDCMREALHRLSSAVKTAWKLKQISVFYFFNRLKLNFIKMTYPKPFQPFPIILRLGANMKYGQIANKLNISRSGVEYFSKKLLETVSTNRRPEFGRDRNHDKKNSTVYSKLF